MNLVIVESPAKAKTIEKILGKDYIVRSSYGHVRDLAKDGYKNTGVEVDNGYIPHYVVPDAKKKSVAELKKLVKTHDKIILATDEDREGEAISWHLKEVLNLPDKRVSRITFTEITPPAIMAAMEHPRTIDIDLVNAQQARRVLDRLFGFELSGLLWKKVRGKLSAGRVQSVAVKLVVEREREIGSFIPVEQYKVSATFLADKKGTEFPAELTANLKNKESAQKLLEACVTAEFTISSIKQSPSTRKPNAPFTTSTLQQSAAQRLGFSVKRTMSTAQKLYEQGFITYMRTDSISISDIALASIASYVEGTFGKNYLTVRKFKSSSKLAQEAHEAIRPSYIDKEHVSENRDEQKLYELIRLRTLSSQMADAKVNKTDISIAISNSPQAFVAKGEVILFDGFMKLYKNTSQSLEDVILPPLEEGQKINYKEIRALQRYSKAPARFTEATLVKKLEELGIGRPSTYAPTIDKITSPERGYVSKEVREGTPTDFITMTLLKGNITEGVISENVGAQKNKLFANDMGMVVTDFLNENFDEIMQYSFTAEVEDKLDEIAQGKENWVETVDKYFKPFVKTIQSTLETAEKATGERILGKDPKTGRTVLVRLSKFGPVVQIGTTEELGEEEKPQYAGLMIGQSIETIAFDDAIKLFELPKSLGLLNDREVVVSRGRFGPYIKYGEDYISIPKTIDLFSIQLNDAKPIIEEKMKEKAPIGDYLDKPITKGIGRFGPYVKWNNSYIAINKRSGFEFATITGPQAVELIKDKEKKDVERTLKEWKEEGIRILQGRWGPFAKLDGDKKMYRLKLPADKEAQKEIIDKMTLAEIKKIVGKKS